jgi:hypothetical protein
VGPNETLKVTADNLSKVQLYAQPGGGDSMEVAWNEVKGYTQVI